MKKLLFVLILLSTISYQPSAAFGQGNLNPPGGPTPSMKSLDQIEARTPIPAAPYTISVPGSYYLTSNLTVSSGNAILITVSGVTLDLNGFTISSTSSPTSGAGIMMGTGGTGLIDISIVNGHIQGGVTYNGGSFSGPGFVYGISFNSTNPGNIRVSQLTVSGVSSSGIAVGSQYSDVVDHCTVWAVGGEGIHAGVVESSTAFQCGTNGINSVTANNCFATSVSSGYAIDSYTAINCYGISNSGHGIDALSVSSSYGVSASGIGVNAQTAENSYGSSSTNIGLLATVATTCSGSSSSFFGLEASSATSSTGTSSTSSGLTSRTANGCSGFSTSGIGLSAGNAANCYGATKNNTALSCTFPGIAAYCVGYNSTNQYPAISTFIAIGCAAHPLSTGGISYSYHYLMPP